MQQIGFTRQFSLLAQEAHLTKNSILSSFDLLLRANYFQDKDGYFYSSFFHLTIGLERLMKLAVVGDHMLKNNYIAPTEGHLKDKFGHHIDGLYRKMSLISQEYRGENINFPNDDSVDFELLEFLTKFGTRTRYFNLNEANKLSNEKGPLEEWCKIAFSIYDEYTSPSVRDREATSLFYEMDRKGIVNNFTTLFGINGELLQVYDILHRQKVVKKSAPLIIWRIIELFSPIHHTLLEISHKASKYEIENGHKAMTIPHFEDFFYFFNAVRPDIVRRRRWLEMFNG